MLKKVLALIAALMITMVAGIAWLVITSPVEIGRVVPAGYMPLIVDTLPVALAIVILIVAIRLCRRSKDWSARLLLAGAIALVAVGFHDFAIALSFNLRLIPGGPSFLFPICTENPLITRPVAFLRILSSLILVGLFGHVFQATRRHLTWSR